MKAKIARKTRHLAKPVRKNIRGKKRLHRAARVTKKAKTKVAKAIPVESEILEARFESPIEFMTMELEPVVEVFDVYESPEGMDDEG